jgi:sporulation protein YlmC with PRC-barrel domain
MSAKAKSKEILDKELWAVDEKIGKVKEMEIDLDDWRVTQLEVELEKDVAESVLGAKKGGVRNMLDISALEKGTIRRTDKAALTNKKRSTSHIPKTSSLDLVGMFPSNILTES